MPYSACVLLNADNTAILLVFINVAISGSLLAYNYTRQSPKETEVTNHTTLTVTEVS